MVSLQIITFGAIFVFLNLCYLGFIIEVMKTEGAKMKRDIDLYLTLWIIVPAMTFAFGILLLSNPKYLEWFG